MVQTKEQLRKLRQKYHLGEYRLSSSRKTGARTSKRRGGTMAKRKSHRSRSGGMGGVIKPALFGGIVAFAARKFGAPKVVPFQSIGIGAGTAFLTGGRSPMKLLAGGAGGAIGGAFAGGSMTLDEQGFLY